MGMSWLRHDHNQEKNCQIIGRVCSLENCSSSTFISPRLKTLRQDFGWRVKLTSKFSGDIVYHEHLSP